MQAGREVKLRRGALWVCAIPMALGLVAAIEIGRAIVENDLQSTWFLGLSDLIYYAAGLLFLPPVTAWLTGFRLQRIDEVERLKKWRTIFISALIIATCVQALTGLGFSIYLSALYKDYLGNEWEGANLYKNFAISNDVLWVALTAPLCAAGASIFRRVTKFPSDRTVF